MENVPGYLRDKKSPLPRIISCLRNTGYTVPPPLVYDMSEYGIPMDRKRMILSASLGGKWVMPERARLVSWDEALRDLLPSLPESPLNKSLSWHVSQIPPATYPALIRAGYDATNFAKKVWREPGRPSPSMPSSNASSWRIMLSESDCRGFSTEAVERLFTWPDGYEWNGLPKTKRVDVMANSVPPGFARAMGAAVLRT
jgi:site-specific DNA-cytosine methylase